MNHAQEILEIPCEQIRIGERHRKVRIAFTAEAKASAAPKPASAAEDEAMQRALAHPEVRRFREVFPDAEVRVARNLRE